MIPPFNHSHVLPPFVGETHSSANGSPYVVSATELVARFATTRERIALLDGLFRYRKAMREIGFVSGFQWLDGSFVENIELHADRPPNDVDIVTFAHPPVGKTNAEISEMLKSHPELFNKEPCRKSFGCDVFLVRLNVLPERLIHETTYWHGFFSHRRGDHVWKGLLQLPLDSDDNTAMTQLSNMRDGGNHAPTT
jgi:hypothetical protein